jgi:hypothetical protein
VINNDDALSCVGARVARGGWRAQEPCCAFRSPIASIRPYLDRFVAARGDKSLEPAGGHDMLLSCDQHIFDMLDADSSAPHTSVATPHQDDPGGLARLPRTEHMCEKKPVFHTFRTRENSPWGFCGRDFFGADAQVPRGIPVTSFPGYFYCLG